MENINKSNIPDDIKSHFDFHDSFVLAAIKESDDYLLYIGNADDGSSPYVKVIFKKLSKINGEKDLSICTELDLEENILFSNCRYIYEDILRTENGYQVKLTLWTPESDLALEPDLYLTVECEDIEFAENITVEEILAKCKGDCNL